ncbi:carbamate kinase [Candidatus Bipolaricaulota bacterium]|nr:carbamate kinase [Candidatus Bipolaricaulota bacterium]
MSTKKVAVVAVGGNSLIKDKARRTIPDQYSAASESMNHFADMVEAGWDVVITHGNGPQVGFILRRSELSLHELHPVPLDYCGADTQGAIGYMFQQALYNEFRQRGVNKQAATVVTQVLVDSKDPAFENPTKPIGSFMEQDTAIKHRNQDGWAVVEDAGRGWRRVVPSPLPVKILQGEAIQTLIQAGFVVIGVGGGGIPVVEDENGDLIGVEAVIDKDLAGERFAEVINADEFLVLTDVEVVKLDYGKPEEKPIFKMTLAEAKKYSDQGHFLAGSMGPKVRACIRFLEWGGKRAVITSLDKAVAALAGETGTHIVRNEVE